MRYLLKRLSILLMMGLAACAPDEPPPPPDVYEVRGQIRQLPRANSPGSSFQLRHEEIPDFRNADGEAVGMKSMTMPLPVADDSLLADLEVGDKVTATLEVRWREGNPLQISALEKLPPETMLDFEVPIDTTLEPDTAEPDIEPEATPEAEEDPSDPA